MFSSQSAARSYQCYWVINPAAGIQRGGGSTGEAKTDSRYCGGNTQEVVIRAEDQGMGPLQPWGTWEISGASDP